MSDVMDEAIVGIDPGTSGGFAALGPRGELLIARRIVSREHGWGGTTRRHVCAESLHAMFDELVVSSIRCVSIERQSPRRGQPAIAMSLGDSLGVCRALSALRVGYENVRHPRPQDWQAEFSAYGEGWTKGRSVELSGELFDVRLRRSEHDVADALLIAEHARRHSS